MPKSGHRKSFGSNGRLFNVGERCDVEKVLLIVRTLSLLFTSPVSKMDIVALP